MRSRVRLYNCNHEKLSIDLDKQGWVSLESALRTA